ncbi:hypothetical protein [Streptomyces lycii]|uniref:Uncharacterized protein n=1 Tax=Streptomyces lycii TaxID=2654337 RepID=A0ABQ7FDE6_9ACTN|nr:hypothetical protein [Streptomyces lycii]KAF4405232.1 hypothetical protein GCU69_31620 [Streptomyces lycii]
MPLIPEEPQIHESVPGPRATPAAGRTAPTPRPVPGPGPRPVPKRPGPPGPSRGSAAPAQRGPRDASSAGPAPSAGSAASAGPAPSGGTARAAGSASPGPQVQLIPASAEGALDAAEEAVDLLLDSGRAPGDVLVLTTGEQHPWAVHELSFGENAYWAQHDAREDIFYADASAAGRTSERPVVVVAVNGGADDAATRALPQAMAKAEALLIVCGDPKRINSLVGAGV